MRILLAVFFICWMMGCSTRPPATEHRTAQGVLEQFPGDVQSFEAWAGHPFTVGGTPVLPTDEIPESTLMQYVGEIVLVSGIWEPGKRWKPTPGEANLPMPVDPGGGTMIRGDGIRVSTIRRMSQ